MNAITLSVFIICMAIMAGCPAKRAAMSQGSSETQTAQSTAAQSAESKENEQTQFIKVEKLTVTDDSLRLNYHVKNIFDHDIWFCRSVHFARPHGEYSVETRFIGQTLHINRYGNLESSQFISGRGWAVYCRLSPGRSSVEEVLLSLPARGHSPVYLPVLPTASEESVTLHQVVFQLGYFSEDLPALLKQSDERGWSPEVRYSPKSEDPNAAFVPYLPYPWTGLKLEQLAQVVIPDVNIPAKVGIPAQ